MDCVKLNSSEFQANWNQMLYQVSATFLWSSQVKLSASRKFSALYIVLFTFSMYTVIRQNPAGRRFFLVTSSIMFLLGTCDVIVSVFLVGIAIKVNKAQAQGSPDLPHLLQLYNTFFIVDAILMVVNKPLVWSLTFFLYVGLVAILLISTQDASSKSYRCYFVWGLRKWVLIGPGLGMLATVVVGSFTATGSESLPKIVFLTPYITAVATSVLLMCLTVWVVAQSIIYEFPNSGPESNIAPTLILVRIGLGHCKWIQDSTQSHGVGPGPMTFRRNSNINGRSIGNPVHTVDFGSVMEMNASNSTAFTRSK
ncbi:hypothetical protein C8J57DRAFT_1212504 [Mycena rebaudengoi]|nr:hypothetical protein C8J57DRAFT_1212504 [Mycena rebaudengoi]